jgi:hypothetical protein
MAPFMAPEGPRPRDPLDPLDRAGFALAYRRLHGLPAALRAEGWAQHHRAVGDAVAQAIWGDIARLIHEIDAARA